MLDYHPVPSTGPLLGGTINAEEALREKGLKVRVAPVYRGRRGRTVSSNRSFSVAALDSLSILSNFKLCLLILLGTAIMFAIMSGMFMRFAVPAIINHYLHYPDANCTVQSYTFFANGVYDTQVQYADSNNVSHTKNITIDENTFGALNLSLGAEFVCLYKGDFLIDKKSVQDQLSSAYRIWYFGFVAGGASSLFLCGMFLLVQVIIHDSANKSGTINYYHRIFSYHEDESIVINDWGPVQPDIQKYMCVLMHTVCNMDSMVSREISFRPSLQNRSAVTKGILIFAAFFLFGMCGGLFVGAYFLGYGSDGYVAFGYFFSICFVIFAFPLMVCALWILRMSAYNRYSVDTKDFTILYAVKPGGISGTLTPLKPGLLSNA